MVARSLEEFVDWLPIACRCVSAALMISHGLRPDSDLVFHLLREGASIRFQASKLRQVRPDERSLSGIFKKAVRAVRRGVTRPASVHSGVMVVKSSADSWLKGIRGRRLYVSQRGAWLEDVARHCREIALYLPLVPTWRGFEDLARDLSLEPVKVSVRRRWTDSLIVIANIVLDKVWLS